MVKGLPERVGMMAGGFQLSYFTPTRGPWNRFAGVLLLSVAVLLALLTLTIAIKAVRNFQEAQAAANALRGIGCGTCLESDLDHAAAFERVWVNEFSLGIFTLGASAVTMIGAVRKFNAGRPAPRSADDAARVSKAHCDTGH